MTFSTAVRLGDQVQPLKDVADAAPAQRGKRSRTEVGEILAIDQDVPAARTVKATGRLHERRLARAAWPRHGHQLAGGDGQADPRERDRLGGGAIVIAA
jgi:hypothetical protein